tara:strand:- start:86 stop:340 length:255 start_codon:yes stop_codon:yes gene_type:complete
MTTLTTRSGRAVKKPVVFIPAENALDDDYCSEDHDTDTGSDIDTEDECYSDESDDEGCDDDDDADENGNLKDFIVDDEDESESE